MISNERLERELVLKTRDLILLYKRYNPKGTYLNISFLQTGDDSGRIHINNAYYDKDHLHPVDVKEDIPV